MEVIVATMDNYHSYVEETCFSSVISTVGCKHGWDIFKSPLSTIFEKCMSSKVDKYCEFLLKVSSKKFGEEQKGVCKCPSSVLVNYLIMQLLAATHHVLRVTTCFLVLLEILIEAKSLSVS